MSSVDTRNASRDSLFMMAEIVLDNDPVQHRVRVRNLSARGVMAEGDLEVPRGCALTIVLRNVGPVRGSVAWREGNRFGIAFESEIDPAGVRAPVEAASEQTYRAPAFVRPAALKQPYSPDPQNLRKI